MKILKIKQLTFVLPFLICLGIIGCNSDYTPKPKDYPKVDYPQKEYQQYTSEFCPLVFEYPKYSTIYRDTTFFGEAPEHPCWINIHYPQFDATIHLSYKELNTRYSLGKLMEDAHKLTYKHAKRADYIEPELISTKNNAFGLVYEVGGEAASATQFYITDTINHFIRGALYFNVPPNPDSLAPVVDFINQDINHLIRTVQWK